MKYSAKPFDQRFTEMGDEAESMYERIKPFGNTIRFGFRRPKGISFRKLPSVVAHMPDYMTETNLVEVMGLGRDGILKSMKVKKFSALKAWPKVARLLDLTGGLWFFVWNSHEKKFAIVTWEKMVPLVTKSVKEFGIKSFEEDKVEYYPLPWEWLVDSASWVGSHDGE